MTIEPCFQRYPVVLPDQTTLETFEFGNGRRRIGFFHGLTGCPSLSTAHFMRLAAKYDATILAPRLPCHGSSSDASGFDEFVAKLGSWAGVIGFDNDCFMGYSMGAIMLPYMADRYPGLASSLLCLAMPTRPVASELDLKARVGLVAVDGLVTTVTGLAHAATHRQAKSYAGPHLAVLKDGVRLEKLLEVLRQVPPMGPVLERLDLRVTCLNGDFDLVAGPRSAKRIGAKSQSHIWWGHGFLGLPWFWDHIGDALGHLLDPQGVTVPAPQSQPSHWHLPHFSLPHVPFPHRATA